MGRLAGDSLLMVLMPIAVSPLKTSAAIFYQIALTLSGFRAYARMRRLCHTMGGITYVQIRNRMRIQLWRLSSRIWIWQLSNDGVRPTNGRRHQLLVDSCLLHLASLAGALRWILLSSKLQANVLWAFVCFA